MAILEVYSDETVCNQGTFELVVTLSGSTDNCIRFRNEIAEIVNSSRKILGKEFRELHAVKLNEGNWSKLFPIYHQVLLILNKFLQNNKLKLLIWIESKKRYQSYGKQLKETLKKSFDSENNYWSNVIGLNPIDHSAIIERTDQLMVLYRFRDLLGEDGDEFIFCPDSKGKILRYKDHTLQVHFEEHTAVSLDFYHLVALSGNAMIKFINKDLRLRGWPTKNQKLIKFVAKDSREDYLIQSCDIISNFYFNFLRYVVGVPDEKVRLKAEEISRLLNLSDHLSEIKSSFTISGSDVICTNDELDVCIT